MKCSLGPVRQLGYAVTDIDAELEYWTNKRGVGPFFVVEHAPFEEVHYLGQSVEIDLTVAIAYSGSMQIELIQQNDAGPSPYRDFIAEYGPGLHHLAVFADDFDDTVLQAQASGEAATFTGSISGFGRFAYFDTAGQHLAVEIGDVGGGTGVTEMFAAFEEAARYWDGSAPVRVVNPAD
ncbi:VOC family protein [Rhodococcus jostii]|uniref:Glyoxalase/Bleomycin resistance protein/Dioxygenase superfamily protein n=2 Tax=Rhodococcus jostii TaxID=132919 RepID=A0A1H4TJ68_RHOJO|nr:VOC family protein [Rhodococcus jostii]SEC56298.1 Glyoxalase/Bleomycin resistance protein/Dioxygenase superfamily protein [Rhodococcus jostii]SEE81829.1 Glyoxalase/Bleomycin resistance protein/Dioxygenase superfamily protein [Rhodococcus jostii]